MKNKVYIAIIGLIALSMMGLVAMQYYWLSTNFTAQKEEVNRDVKKALNRVGGQVKEELNNRINIDTDHLDEIDLYFENSDSTFQFLMEPLSRKRNKDGSVYQLNETVYNYRMNQLKKVMNDLLIDNPLKEASPNGDLTEGFIVLYGQDSKRQEKEKSWSVLVEQLKVKESIVSQLKENGLALKFDYGIYNREEQTWEYQSQESDTTRLLASDLMVKLSDDEEAIYLTIENPTRFVLKNMLRSLLLSIFLVCIILSSFFYLISIIWKQKRDEEIKTDFINNMTHEFKTPLATIAFAVANIDNPTIIKNEDMVRQFTGVIKEENKRMNRQVEQVLTAALADKEALKLKKEQVDVHEIINNLTKRLQLQMQGENQSFTISLNAEKAVITGDKVHLTNMISNLLDNAQKYSPNTQHITIETQNSNSQLLIKVSDQGIGMSKETIKKIFDKFYRVPTGNLHNIKGFGLGLSYAKTVAEQHDGAITVDSTINKGSAFTISLPVNS